MAKDSDEQLRREVAALMEEVETLMAELKAVTKRAIVAEEQIAAMMDLHPALRAVTPEGKRKTVRSKGKRKTAKKHNESPQLPQRWETRTLRRALCPGSGVPTVGIPEREDSCAIEDAPQRKEND